MTITDTEVVAPSGKRERILRAAVAVFARTGYFAAKVSEIAKEASVADGTIYLYFQGKEDLLVTIFRDHMQRHLVLLEKELAHSSGPEDALRRAIRFHLSTLGNDRSLAVVFQVQLRQSLKFMSQLSHEELGDYLNILRRIVEDGQRQGVFRKSLHPQFIAKSVFGILDEMMTSWILSDKEYRPEEHSEQIAEFVLRGLM